MPRDADRSSEDPGLNVIARAAAILRALEAQVDGLSIAELTRRTGLPRTTVTRLARALADEALLSLQGSRVRLGPALSRLAAAAHRDVLSVIHPHLVALAQATGETVNLWLECQEEVLLVEQAPSRQEIHIAAAPGARLPLHSTAPGKAFLAREDEARLAQRLPARWEASTEHTLRTQEALRQDLARIRASGGLATDLEEHVDDICAVARCLGTGSAPLARYALAVVAPARRFRAHQAALAAALSACVTAIRADASD